MDLEIVTFLRNQEVKQTNKTKKNTVITWSSTIIEFSAQYKLFSQILYSILKK